MPRPSRTPQVAGHPPCLATPSLSAVQGAHLRASRMATPEAVRRLPRLPSPPADIPGGARFPPLRDPDLPGRTPCESQKPAGGATRLKDSADPARPLPVSPLAEPPRRAARQGQPEKPLAGHSAEMNPPRIAIHAKRHRIYLRAGQSYLAAWLSFRPVYARQEPSGVNYAFLLRHAMPASDINPASANVPGSGAAAESAKSKPEPPRIVRGPV